MADYLDEAREKVRRARTHLEELKARREAWTLEKGNTQYEIGKHFDPKENCFIFVVEAGGSVEAPREWGAIIGDVVHNARSALDYLAWQLVDLGAASKPLKSPQLVQFPVLVQGPPPHVTPMQTLKDKAATRLPGVSDTELSVILRYQPFVARRDAPERHPLAMLIALSNHDKHRRLRVARSFIQQFGGDIFRPVNFTRPRISAPLVGELQPGAEVLRVYGEPTGEGEPDVHVEFDGTGIFIFADSDLPVLSVEDTLRAILGQADAILDEFGRLL